MPRQTAKRFSHSRCVIAAGLRLRADHRHSSLPGRYLQHRHAGGAAGHDRRRHRAGGGQALHLLLPLRGGGRLPGHTLHEVSWLARLLVLCPSCVTQTDCVAAQALPPAPGQDRAQCILFRAASRRDTAGCDVRHPAVMCLAGILGRVTPAWRLHGWRAVRAGAQVGSHCVQHHGIADRVTGPCWCGSDS